MHYDPTARDSGLRHDPFKALVVPRPIGWVATLGRDGVANLAPYSFFNAVNEHPPMLMFSSAGRKDSLRNVLDTGEFTCSLATWPQREAMNLSSAAVGPQVDEFTLSGVRPAPSRVVAPPRVAGAPAAFECRLWQTLEMPSAGAAPGCTVVFGTVVSIYIDDNFIRDGHVDITAMQPLARLGYMDYAVVDARNVFTMNRPLPSADGLSAQVPAGDWDGVCR